MRAVLISSGLKAVFCDQFVKVALSELSISAGDTPVEIVKLDHHVMLVIGRNPCSKPDDIDTWGKNAVIYDPWANRFYEANQFKSEHEHGKKFK